MAWQGTEADLDSADVVAIVAALGAVGASLERGKAMRRKVRITNEFHGTSAEARPTVLAGGDLRFTLRQVARLRALLCGIPGCRCGGSLSERGRQAGIGPLLSVSPDGALVFERLRPEEV